MFTRGAFVAKLPASRIRDLTQAGMGRPYEPAPGRMMKEWIATERGDWVALAREAYTFVNLGSSKSRATAHRSRFSVEDSSFEPLSPCRSAEPGSTPQTRSFRAIGLC